LLSDGTADPPRSASYQNNFIGEVHGYDFSGTVRLDEVPARF
jgi:hypothetical protein